MLNTMKRGRWNIPFIIHNPHGNRIMLAIYDWRLFNNNVHPLKCKVHLMRIWVILWFHSLRKKKRNREPGAKVSYIFLKHYLLCALVYTVCDCWLQLACLYLCCVCIYVCGGGARATWAYCVGISFCCVKDCCRVVSQIQWYVMYIHYLMYSKWTWFF